MLKYVFFMISTGIPQHDSIQSKFVTNYMQHRLKLIAALCFDYYV
jgi:hypothetical protein